MTALGVAERIMEIVLGSTGQFPKINGIARKAVA
jgi:hypothetical protein